MCVSVYKDRKPPDPLPLSGHAFGRWKVLSVMRRLSSMAGNNVADGSEEEKVGMEDVGKINRGKWEKVLSRISKKKKDLTVI